MKICQSLSRSGLLESFLQHRAASAIGNTSDVSIFFHNVMNNLYTNVFLSIPLLSINFVVKCAAKNLDNGLTIKNFMSKTNFHRKGK